MLPGGGEEMKVKMIGLMIVAVGMAACGVKPGNNFEQGEAETGKTPSVDSGSPEVLPAGAVELSEADSSKTVIVTAGSLITVSLEGNLTTGYSWSVDEIDPQYLGREGEPQYERNSKLTGAGEVTIFTFKALKLGETRLLLVYMRPFEASKPPEKSFEVGIEIK